MSTEPIPTDRPARQLVTDFYTSYLLNDVKFSGRGIALAAAHARKDLSSLAKACKHARKEIQLAKVAKIAEKRAAKLATKS